MLIEDFSFQSLLICTTRISRKKEQLYYKATKHVDNGLKEITKSKAVAMHRPVTISAV